MSGFCALLDRTGAPLPEGSLDPLMADLAVLGFEALDPADLALRAAEPLQQLVLVLAVPVGPAGLVLVLVHMRSIPCGGIRSGWSSPARAPSQGAVPRECCTWMFSGTLGACLRCFPASR